MEKTKTVTIKKMPHTTWKQIRIQALEEGLEIAELIEKIIKAYLKDNVKI